MKTPILSQAERGKRLNEILSRGHGTAQELLALEYGQWPPPGIDIDPCFETPTPLVFKNVFHAGNGSKGATQIKYDLLTGRRDLSKPIPIESELSSDSAYASINISIMAHEALHALYREACDIDYWITPYNRSGKTVEQIEGGFNDKLEPLIAAGETAEGTRHRHEELARLRSKNGPNDAFPEVYYLQQTEILARANTILTSILRGETSQPKSILASLFHRKPAPPNTQEQFSLMAALLLREDPSDRFRHTYSALRTARDIRENIVQRIPGTHQAAFFQEALPDIFGTLLEILGDPQGRVKMGLKAGPFYGRQLGKRMNYEVSHPQEKSWPAETWRLLAEKAEPETREGLIRFAEKLGHSVALPILLKTYRQKQTQTVPVPFQRASGIQNTAGPKKDDLTASEHR